MPSESFFPRNPTYMDMQNKIQNDIYLEPPDFSEFQDPWENYYVPNDSVIHKAENNKRQQYYFKINSSSPISILNESSKSVCQSQSSPECNREFYHNQQCSENMSSSHMRNHHNQVQSNQFMNEIKQQYLFPNSNDTSTLNVESNHQQTQDNIEKYISVHNMQYHHSSESHYQSTNNQYISQSTCNDSNRLVSEEIMQHQHIEYKHSSNNSNKSFSEEIKQHQHNETYVDHHCSYCQMFDNLNNKQLVQHYGQGNQTCKSLDVNINHDQAMPNIAYQNNLSNKQNTEQNENINVTDKRTSTLISTSPHPDSKPCTDFHNVATQSDLHIMDDPNSSNAGLAGALAQMTLGEPRSAEQIALEEHMRKQSWEQGQIDYMGRDSFDNIWKKICETLALAPPRLPSPPKETQKPEKTTTDKTDESVKSTEAIQSTESIDEVDKETGTEDSN